MLNIKNAEAHTLASELARLRQVSLTTAVTDALRNELNRERNRAAKAGLAIELLEIGRRCAAHIHAPLASEDHAAILYDERGLPR